MIDSLLGKGLPTNIQNVDKVRETQRISASSGLNATQQQLADQISLSEESQQALETLKRLDQQLTRFLDVLKGNRSADSVIEELNAEDNGFIAGIESRTALSVSQIESIQETTSLSAEITDEGELDLILTQTRERISSSSLSLSTEEFSYLASL